MTALDRWLQRYRARIALQWIPEGGRLLDIGCHQGELLLRAASHIASGTGIDPLARPQSIGNVHIIKGMFPSPHIEGLFDAITILAVLEHIPDQQRLVEACVDRLAPGGRLIITVPSPLVDHVLPILLKLRLIHGMSLEEHNGYRPEGTVQMFERAGLRSLCARRFQIGFNHLFVFERPRVCRFNTTEPSRSLWMGCPVP